MPHLRRKASDAVVPDWSELRDPVTFQSFMRMIEDELRRGDIVFAIEGHEVVAAIDDEPRRLNLHALSRKWAVAASADDKRELIADHIRVFGAADPASRFAAHPHPRSLLRLQLYQRADLSDTMIDRIVSVPAPTGLIAAVAIELDDCIAAIGAKDLEPAGLSTSELVQLAIDNVREQLADPVRARYDAEGVHIHVAKGDTDFQNVQLLWPEEVLPFDPGLGALLAAPSRRVVIGCAVARGSVQRQIVQTATTAMKLYDASPGLRLSPGVHWFRDGEFLPVTTPHGDKISVTVPAALQAFDHP